MSTREAEREEGYWNHKLAVQEEDEPVIKPPKTDAAPHDPS